MKLTEEQWSEAKGLYVNGKMSYRDLATHYGVALSTVYKRGKDESWGTLREDVSEKTTTETTAVFSMQSIQQARQLGDIYCRFVNILNEISADIEDRIKDGGWIPAKELGGYVRALQTLKEIGNIRTDDELREQNARLRLLEKQIAESAENGNVNITVSFEGVDGCEV